MFKKKQYFFAQILTFFTFEGFPVSSHCRRVGTLRACSGDADSCDMWGIIWIRLLETVCRPTVYPRTNGLSSISCRYLSNCALKIDREQPVMLRISLGRALNNWDPWCEKLPSRKRLTLAGALRAGDGILQVRPFREFSKWSCWIPLFPSHEMLGTCSSRIFQT